MKKIISARRENGQIVFYKSRNDAPTEFQALALDFNNFQRPVHSAKERIQFLEKQYEGLSDWKIEDIKE